MKEILNNTAGVSKFSGHFANRNWLELLHFRFGNLGYVGFQRNLEICIYYLFLVTFAKNIHHGKKHFNIAGKSLRRIY